MKRKNSPHSKPGVFPRSSHRVKSKPVGAPELQMSEQNAVNSLARFSGCFWLTRHGVCRRVRSSRRSRENQKADSGVRVGSQENAMGSLAAFDCDVFFGKLPVRRGR